MKGEGQADGGGGGGGGGSGGGVCLFSGGIPVGVRARLNEREGAAGGERRGRRRSARTQLNGTEAALLGAGETSQEVTRGCGVVTLVSLPCPPPVGWISALSSSLLVPSVVIVAFETQKVVKAASVLEVTSNT